MEIVKLKAGTTLAAIVKLTGSRKRSAIIARPATEVRLSGAYWDGGSRSDYFLVNMKTMECVALPHTNPPQFGGPKEDPVQHILPHQAVIEAGTFCGKPATPTVYLHPGWGQEALSGGEPYPTEA